MKMTLFLAYLDINPFSRGHTLVIPKSHSEGLLDTDEEILPELIRCVKRVAAKVKAATKCTGFNILQNNGESAGQTVKHIHFHIVPRYGSSAIVFENHEGDMQELSSLADAIRNA